MRQIFKDNPRLGLVVLLGVLQVLTFGGVFAWLVMLGHTPLKSRQLLIAFGVLLLLSAVGVWLVLWLLRPLPPGPARWEVFVRAAPETVWDTYHMHVKQAQYRPGRRIISVEQISDTPPTYRTTTQMDFLPGPTIATERYTVYERPFHYELDSESEFDGERLTGREEGWLEPAPGGTTLRIATWVDQDRPWLPAKLAWRRINRNLQALAAYCEGRPVPAPRPPLAESWFSRHGFFVVLVVWLGADGLGLPERVALTPWIFWSAWMAVRGIRLARRIS